MDESEHTVNILFLDEISAAPPSVQAAAYQITLDRTVGEHRLPENCIVIAAGNRITDKSVAYHMPKGYSREDYLAMHERIFARQKAEIRKIYVQEQELLAMKKHCKEQGISLTAYMASELMKKGDLDLLCLPVDTRSTRGLFGNYVGRIDIEKKSLRKQENIPQAIQQKIRQALEDKGAQIRSELLLSKIPPQFYDDVIFDRYGDRPKPPVRSTARLPGYKDPRPTAFLSNLKEVQLQAEDVSDLCFYPPHPAERYATMGVVTHKNQMVITVQKFRKDGCNE